MTPDAASLAQLLRQVDPGLRLVRARNLTGGVSAQVTVVSAARWDGQERNIVVRQYGGADLRSNPRIACTEYRLLTLLYAAGLRVPRPYRADESCAVLPVPCLILEFIDGEPPTGPGAPPHFAGQFAAALAELHKAGFTRSDAAFLPDIGIISARMLGTRPAVLDDMVSEAAVRTALTGNWPPRQVNEPAILHGDYWPGNTLWRDGNLVGVIDWEDAAFGDPLADLGNARLEVLMHYGDAAMDEFTRQYCVLMPGLDLASLPYWDLYAALRPAGQMDSWGLPEARLERFRGAHRTLVAAALTRLETE